MGKLNYKKRRFLIIICIIGIALLFLAIIRLNNSEMQSAMRISELKQGLAGEMPDPKLEKYFFISYLFLDIGFSFIILTIFGILQLVIKQNIKSIDQRLFNIGSITFALSAIGYFVSLVITQKPLNRLLILSSKDGIISMPPDLKKMLFFRNSLVFILILSIIVIVLSVKQKNDRGKANVKNN